MYVCMYMYYQEFIIYVERESTQRCIAHSQHNALCCMYVCIYRMTGKFDKEFN